MVLGGRWAGVPGTRRGSSWEAFASQNQSLHLTSYSRASYTGPSCFLCASVCEFSAGHSGRAPHGPRPAGRPQRAGEGCRQSLSWEASGTGPHFLSLSPHL